jgi:hypothetical protein
VGGKLRGPDIWGDVGRTRLVKAIPMVTRLGMRGF